MEVECENECFDAFRHAMGVLNHTCEGGPECGEMHNLHQGIDSVDKNIEKLLQHMERKVEAGDIIDFRIGAQQKAILVS